MIALGYLLGDREQRRARLVELVERLEQVLAHGEPLDGRADILAAAAGVQPGHVRPADLDQRILDDEVVARTRRARQIAVGDHPAHRVGDLAAERFRHDPGLDHHDGRGLVDFAQPVEWVTLLGSTRHDHCEYPDGGEPKAPADPW